MMITDAESSSRREWVKKLRLIPSAKNSKDISSESTEDSTRTDLPWNRESFATTGSDCFFHQVHPDIELREKDREREDLSEVVLLAPTSKLFLSPWSRRAKRRFPDSLMILDQEDLVLREPLESANFTELRKSRERRPWPALALLLRSTSFEEPSTARKLLMLKGKKLQKFKDWSLNQD